MDCMNDGAMVMYVRVDSLHAYESRAFDSHHLEIV